MATNPTFDRLKLLARLEMIIAAFTIVADQCLLVAGDRQAYCGQIRTGKRAHHICPHHMYPAHLPYQLFMDHQLCQRTVKNDIHRLCDHAHSECDC